MMHCSLCCNLGNTHTDMHITWKKFVVVCHTEKQREVIADVTSLRVHQYIPADVTDMLTCNRYRYSQLSRLPAELFETHHL